MGTKRIVLSVGARTGTIKLAMHGWYLGLVALIYSIVGLLIVLYRLSDRQSETADYWGIL